MKKAVIIIPAIILLFVSGILFFVCYNKTEDVHNFLQGDKLSANIELIDIQRQVNSRLKKISSEKKYTFKDAYVELNPYKVSPLSGIIIFQTSKEEAITVTINDKEIGTLEPTKKHIIPVYGFYEGRENIVKLFNGEEEVSYAFVTEKSNLDYPFTVNYKESVNNEELYFTVSSYQSYLSAFDSDGNLRFYLTVDNRMDVEWLANGHFLIGTSQGQFAENFCAFVEMDYLGKVYNYYVPENGYSFEFQALSDGNYMLAGGDKPVYINEQVVYTIDSTNGKKISEVNITNILKSIDPDIDTKYLGQKAIRNSFYYNEETGELLVSLRGIDSIVSINYSDKTLNWIFTNPDNPIFKNDVWKSYFVTLKSGRYPLGQHSVVITNEGNIAFFNNGYNRYNGFENGGEDKVSAYLENYSSAEVYKITDRVARLVYSNDQGKKVFSHQYGSINETSNNNYLINFGYSLKDEYRAKENATLSEAESNSDNIYSKIVEVNKAGKVVFEAISYEGRFRAFKHSIYDSFKNLEVEVFNSFYTLEKDPLLDQNYTALNIKNARKWIYSTEFTRNTFKTDYDILEDDNIDLYLVNRTGKVYIMNYKNKTSLQLNRIFNISLPNGEYALYINLNGETFNTNNVYKF